MTNPTACPATGRSASVCLDPTHVGCIAGAAESRRLDERVIAERIALDEPPGSVYRDMRPASASAALANVVGDKCNTCRLNDTYIDGRCTNCGSED